MDNNRPPLAQPGAEFARQAGIDTTNDPQVQAAISDYNTASQRQKSFTNYLTDKRMAIEGATAPTGELGQAQTRLRDFGSFQGVNPIEVARAYNDFADTNISFRERAIQAEQDAINQQKADATNLINTLFGIKQKQADLKRAELDIKKQEEELNQLSGIASEQGIDPTTGQKTYTLSDGTILTEDEYKKAGLSGDSAVLEVLKQGGDKLLKNVNKSDLGDFAQEILRQGGVEKYLKSVPLTSLMEQKEIDAANAQGQLETKIIRAISALQTLGEGAGGTGPFARFIPGFARSEKGAEAVGLIGELTAEKIKEISGATVSDAEARRLSKFLPDVGKTETRNIEDLNRLRTGLRINSELFELAKRSGLTLDQALQQFGKQIFENNGEVWPYGEGETKAQTTNKKSGSYTIEQIGD